MLIWFWKIDNAQSNRKMLLNWKKIVQLETIISNESEPSNDWFNYLPTNKVLYRCLTYFLWRSSTIKEIPQNMLAFMRGHTKNARECEEGLYSIACAKFMNCFSIILFVSSYERFNTVKELYLQFWAVSESFFRFRLFYIRNVLESWWSRSSLRTKHIFNDMSNSLKCYVLFLGMSFD